MILIVGSMQSSGTTACAMLSTNSHSFAARCIAPEAHHRLA